MKEDAAATLVWIAAAALAAGSAAFVSRMVGATPLEAGLPFFVAAGMFCGWLVRKTRWSSPIAAASALMVAAVAAAPAAVRASLLGLLIASAIAMAIRALHASETLTARAGASILMIGLAVMRLPGVPPGKVLETAGIIIGCVVLFITLVAGRKVSPVHLLLAWVAGVMVPLYPSRLAVIPLVLAALVWTTRTVRIPIPSMVLAILCVLAGRWSWPLALIGIGVALMARTRLRAAESIALGPLAPMTAIAQLVRPLPFLVAGAGAVRSAPYAAAGALVLVLMAAVLRPSLAIFYGIAASVTLASRDETGSARYAGPAAVVAFLMLAMFPWSGALAAAFPLPLTFTIFCFILLAAAATMLRSRLLASAFLSIGALAAVILSTSPDAGNWKPVMAVLGPGESVNIMAAGEGSVAELLVSGGNLLELPSGEIIADVDVISEGGTVYRRALPIGDTADWAALRQEHWFIAQHGAPMRPAGPLEGFGASSYLSGAGIVDVTIPERIRLVRVTMRENAPAGASLHIDALRILAPEQARIAEANEDGPS